MTDRQPTDDELLQQAIAEYERDAYDEEADKTLFTPEEKESQYKFMNNLIDTPESTKIGVTTSEELGKTTLSLRGALKVALLAETLGLDTTAKYHRKMAEIIASTSMSRKGTFLQLLFTQIKKHITTSTRGEWTQQKQGLFSKKNKDNPYQGALDVQ